MNRGQLTAWQLFWMALLTMLPTLVLVLPGELIRLAGRSAWWTPLTAGLPATAFAWVVGRSAASRGDLVGAALRVLGPVAGRLLLGAVWVAVGGYAVVATREVAEGAAATFVIGTVPIPVLILLAFIPVGVLAWLGPVVTARTATLLSPALTLTYVGGIVVAVPVLHLLWALPLLPQDLRFATWPPLGLAWVWLVEPTLLGVLLMHRVDPPARRAAGRLLAGTTLAGAMLSAVGLWALVADFGPGRAAEFLIPFLHVAQDLAYSTFLEHADTLVMPVEILGGMIKLAIVFWLWSRVGEGLLGRGRTAALLAELGVGGPLSFALFRDLLSVDRSFYRLADYALPLLAASLLLTYGLASLGRKRQWPRRTWGS